MIPDVADVLPDDAVPQGDTSQPCDDVRPSVDPLQSHCRSPIGVAVACLVVTSILWGFSFPCTKTVNLQVDHYFGVHADASSWSLRLASASWLMFWRFGLALLVFGVLFRRVVARATWAEWRAGTLIGLCFSSGLILQIIGMATLSASRSGFLTSLVAVFTPLITAVAIRTWPRPQVAIGVVVALLGVATLTGLFTAGSESADVPGGGQQPLWSWGDTLTTLGAVLFASQICLVDFYGRRLHAAALTPGMFASTALTGLALFLATVTLVPERPQAGPAAGHIWLSLSAQPGFWLPVLALCLLSTVLAFHLMNSYQHHVTASQAGVIYTLEPVFAATAAMSLPGGLSWITGLSYPNEQLVIAMLVGGGLIVTANLISLWPNQSSFLTLRLRK